MVGCVISKTDFPEASSFGWITVVKYGFTTYDVNLLYSSGSVFESNKNFTKTAKTLAKVDRHLS